MKITNNPHRLNPTQLKIIKILRNDNFMNQRIILPTTCLIIIIFFSGSMIGIIKDFGQKEITYGYEPLFIFIFTVIGILSTRRL